MKSRCSYLKLLIISFLLTFLTNPTFGQDTRKEVAGIPVNYDESKIPAYSLPDPLVLSNGKKVTDSKTWYKK